MPTDIGIIDTMIGFPSTDPAANYAFFRGNIKDAESKATMFPVEYLFKHNVPGAIEEELDPIATTLAQMDTYGIEIGMVGAEGVAREAMEAHPTRFVGSVSVDPNDVVGSVRKIRRLHEECDVRAVTGFPAGCTPQVPISDAKWYPIYALCCELDLAMFMCAGIPGPRLPSMCQHVEMLDIVCYDFPELRLVTRHGCQPWTELAVKLMLKWPNLYYSTSAFAPKHYDPRIIDYANTRGADRVIYAGYFPMGLQLSRIFGDMPNVAFNDNVWPKFLRDNAAKVLRLDQRPAGQR